MAQIDSSIYLQQQAPDFLGNFTQGLKMRDMMDQRKVQQDQVAKQKGIEQAYAAGFETQPDGTVKQNSAKTVSALANAGYGQEALSSQTQFTQNQLAQQKAQHDMQVQKYDDVGRIAGAALQNPTNYPQYRKEAISKGYASENELPEVFDPNLMKSFVYKSMVGKDQLEAEAKARGLDIQQQEANAKTKTAQDTHLDRIARFGQAAESKQADAYQKATHDINTFKGNSAVQQASTALTNAKNAMSLADKGNLSTDQLHLFASEMGKLATGGVPGHSEIEALIPDTAKTRLAKVTSFFANSPSDADAQAFINNNKTYLRELLSNYSGVVDTYKNNSLDGWKKKLRPEDYNELKHKIAIQSAAPTTESSSKPAWAK